MDDTNLPSNTPLPLRSVPSPTTAALSSPTPLQPQPRQQPASTSREPSKMQRVLACVLCQQRKIKCDRRFPCAQCVKYNAPCVPSTQARRRRRRFPERELLSRIDMYESMLRQNKVKFEPLHEQTGGLEKDTPEGDEESDEDGLETAVSLSSPQSGSVKSEGTVAAKSIWRAMSQEPQGLLDNEDDSPISHALRAELTTALDETPFEDPLMFGCRQAIVDLSTFHPPTVEIFRLWQTYLDNVDPLFKVTHAPTLQARIIEAASDLTKVEPALEALMFAIYAVATLSLADNGTWNNPDFPEHLLIKYRFGCQQALANARYLWSNDRDCLTALFLYLLSARIRSNPRSLFPMLGVAVRIAQCMGINNESSLAKYSVFEAEMRRRLWWSLMLYDSRMSEKADHKDTSLDPTWDCRQPLNVNDSDLRPDMKEPPPAKETATEATFIVVRSDIAEFIRHSSFHLDFTNPVLKPIAKELPQGGSVTVLEQRIQSQYLRHCDPDNPLHFMTTQLAIMTFAKSRLYQFYCAHSSNPGKLTDEQRDMALSLAIEMLECEGRILLSPLAAGFCWHLQTYFPFPAYMHVIQDLRRRPLSQLAPQAWKVMSNNFETRIPPGKLGFHPIIMMFGRLVMLAWTALEAAVEAPEALQPPKLVMNVRAREARQAQEQREFAAAAASEQFSASSGSLITDESMAMGDGDFLSGMGDQSSFFGTGDNAMGGMDSLSFNQTQFQWPPPGWSLE